MKICHQKTIFNDLLPLPVEQYLHGFDARLRVLPEADRREVVRCVRHSIVAQIEAAPPTLMGLFEHFGLPEHKARGFILYYDLSTCVRRRKMRRLFVVMLLFAAGNRVALGAVMATLGLFACAIGILTLALWSVGGAAPSGMPTLFFVSPGGYFAIVLAGLCTMLCIALGARILQSAGRMMLRRNLSLPRAWRCDLHENVLAFHAPP